MLYILLSYFEMISKFEAGSSSGKSGVWFRKGLEAVFPDITSHSERADILAQVWKGARCGLYHAAMTGTKVFISKDVSGIFYDSECGCIFVNPSDLIDGVTTHFDHYIARLRDPTQVVLRKNFVKKFDQEILTQMV